MIESTRGQQAGTENFFEISQKHSSVCWQLCVPTEIKFLVEVPSEKDSSPHSFRPPASTPVKIQLGWRITAARKLKKSFAYGVCLQNNELLYYLRKYSSVVKNVTRPAPPHPRLPSPLPQVWGRKWQAMRGENKRKVVTAYLLLPGTLRAVKEYLTRWIAKPYRSLKSEKELNYFLLFPHRFYWDQGGLTWDFHPSPARSYFYQLRLGPTERLRRVRETSSLLLEVSNGGHT